jgi:hypothetical protein
VPHFGGSDDNDISKKFPFPLASLANLVAATYITDQSRKVRGEIFEMPVIYLHKEKEQENFRQMRSHEAGVYKTTVKL